MAAQLTFLDQDLTDFVINWGSIEQVKEILLAEAQLFVSEVSLTLANSKNEFSPDFQFSIIKGVEWYNQTATIAEDGKDIFKGLVKDITYDKQDRTVSLVLENVFSKPAESFVTSSASNINPASAMEAILVAAGLEDDIDSASFATAGSEARAAGAVMSYSFAESDGVSVMTAINNISKLSSISVFTDGVKFIARNFKTYQGNESGLKEPLAPATIVEFDKAVSDKDIFANRVIFGFSTSSEFVVEDAASIRKNRITRPISLDFTDSQNISIADAASAEFFAVKYLSKSKDRVTIITFVLDRKHKNVTIGDRYPVTEVDAGFLSAPYEVIEARRRINEDDTTVMATSLE